MRPPPGPPLSGPNAVSIRPTRDNPLSVADLIPHLGQEAPVAVNVASIANASAEPAFVPLAIYAGAGSASRVHWHAVAVSAPSPYPSHP